MVLKEPGVGEEERNESRAEGRRREYSSPQVTEVACLDLEGGVPSGVEGYLQGDLCIDLLKRKCQIPDLQPGGRGGAATTQNWEKPKRSRLGGSRGGC